MHATQDSHWAQGRSPARLLSDYATTSIRQRASKRMSNTCFYTCPCKAMPPHRHSIAKHSLDEAVDRVCPGSRMSACLPLSARALQTRGLLLIVHAHGLHSCTTWASGFSRRCANAERRTNGLAREQIITSLHGLGGRQSRECS
ncbi:hypothetical protein IE81DRAFT_234535 [Ceraceosorus guamensis]|uniref:Uncharacterized protein n=1 Tax=Ceraceosorus guamensis TaxID=1522189 RepID=A0A316VSS9_9BASI|nr:hypothetical protein IE81DRAFT_234535 [Ceraceosorus guamensis]PWN40274.1 hypothetical protein IE81DRAFT_234535 [Ceraceosorus guamensis]